jgi:hypothetical protein
MPRDPDDRASGRAAFLLADTSIRYGHPARGSSLR